MKTKCKTIPPWKTRSHPLLTRKTSPFLLDFWTSRISIVFEVSTESHWNMLRFDSFDRQRHGPWEILRSLKDVWGFWRFWWLVTVSSKSPHCVFLFDCTRPRLRANPEKVKYRPVFLLCVVCKTCELRIRAWGWIPIWCLTCLELSEFPPHLELFTPYLLQTILKRTRKTHNSFTTSLLCKSGNVNSWICWKARAPFVDSLNALFKLLI